MKYLIVNNGSASKKYAFYDGDKKIYSAHFEVENGGQIVTETIGNSPIKKSITQKDFVKAVEYVIDSLIVNKIVKSKKDISTVGIRIVAPGNYFLQNKIIDNEYLKMAKATLEKVPLHLGPALEEIVKIKKALGNKQKIVGVSDSAFHSTIPEYARLYAIPIKDSRRLNLYRFGYHGISVQSVVSKAKATLGSLPEKVVICHLGGGASVTAVKNGQSIDTSMGFTPLEGLVMATRVGDIDAGAVLYLAEKLKKNYKQLEQYFNNECGLLGLSGGKNSGVRELVEAEIKGDADSALVLKIYANRLKQYIGRMSVVLGGIDLLIFAGTVGERSFVMRGKVCDGLQFLGIDLDADVNNKSEGIDVEISKAGSKTKVLVVKTDEMVEIAKVTSEF